MHELTSSAPITLLEEFLSLDTPPEFVSLDLLDCRPPGEVGGRVSFCLNNWQVITQDPWVLSVVKEGYQIEWVSKPCQMVPPFQPTFSPEMNVLVDKEVQDMILKGAIIEVSRTQGQYVSTIFLVTEKDGGMRPVINLKYLNHLVRYEHFQMEGLGSLLNSLVTNEFLTKLDLKDAYFTLPIHLKDRKYLRFRWRGKLFQFQVLPFGLSSAPRVFTRVMKAPMTFLRRHAFKSVVYLDDICLANPQGQAPPKTLVTAWLLERLGFIINWNKSSAHPSQKEEFLGFIADTVNLLVILPQMKVDKIISICTDLLERKGCALRTLASLIGKLQNALTAILPAPLHFRLMQMANIRALAKEQQNYAANLILPESALSELRWWVRNLSTWNGKSFLNPDPELDIVITSDASLLVSDRDVAAHQCAGIEGSRVSSEILQGPLGGQPCSFTIGQHDSCLTDCENGVIAVEKVSGGDQRNMGVCFIAREHDYCSAYSGQTKHHRGLRESDLPRQQQLEAVSTGLPRSKNVSLDRSGSLCRSTESPGPTILELETGPTGRRCRRTDSGLERDESVRLSTLQINSQGVAESPQRRCNFTPGSSGVVPTTLVSHVVGDADRATSVDTFLTSPSNGSRRGPTSHVSEPEAGPSGLASLRGSGKGPELSADARDLVAKARSSGTTRAYKSGRKKFSSWCDQRQTNPVSCPVELVVNFLAAQQRLVLFGTLAGYRSAISHFHEKVDGMPVGKHPLVVEVMKGSFPENPPVPRYTHTWDINIVLTYL